LQLQDVVNPVVMRPPPRSIEEWFYRYLMDSPGFHRWVKRVHARINRIPFEEPLVQNGVKVNVHNYKPTMVHKFHAFRVVWADEMKRTFGLRK